MGRATAHLFADEGAKVAVTDLGEDRVQAVVDEIAGAGGTAHGWVFDVADPERIKAVVAEVEQAFGGLDQRRLGIPRQVLQGRFPRPLVDLGGGIEHVLRSAQGEAQAAGEDPVGEALFSPADDVEDPSCLPAPGFDDGTGIDVTEVDVEDGARALPKYVGAREAPGVVEFHHSIADIGRFG